MTIMCKIIIIYLATALGTGPLIILALRSVWGSAYTNTQSHLTDHTGYKGHALTNRNL